MRFNYIILKIVINKRGDFMSKGNHMFDFNYSKNILITELDKLKVVNADNSTNTNLLCRRINNKIKFMLYTNNTPGTYSTHKGVLDTYTFQGEIEIFKKESTSYISGSFKSGLGTIFFTVLGFIFSLIFPMMGIFAGFVVKELLFIPVIFLGGIIFFKKNTENRLLNKIKEFEEKVNLHI